MATGKIKFFDEVRGFGFVIPDDGGGDLYLNARGCLSGYWPCEGDKVEYRIGAHPDGKPRADKVALID